MENSIDNMLEVLQAYKDEKTIEARPKNGFETEWHVVHKPVWDFNTCEYRIADPETLKPEVTEYYVARDGDGALHLFEHLPSKDNDKCVWMPSQHAAEPPMRLDSNMFGGLTHYDRPLRVAFVDVFGKDSETDRLSHDFKVGDCIYFFDNFRDGLDCVEITDFDDESYISVCDNVITRISRKMAYRKEDIDTLFKNMSL